MTPKRFRDLVLADYKKNGRHTLPWRRTKDAYRILVSEVMLQQTQVERAIPFYERFLARFPTAATLAEASLADVLTLWQGLGYNRRAKMLHEAAKLVVRDFKGKVPTNPGQLALLPGVGPYTARAVAAFSNNSNVLFVETNIRTAVIHHFFPDSEKVPDTEVLLILEKAYPAGHAREWYSALMDYGSRLKRSGIRVNAKSAGYAKQKTFAGSSREARGAILRSLSTGPQTRAGLHKVLGPERREQLAEQTSVLLKEKLIELKNREFQLPA